MAKIRSEMTARIVPLGSRAGADSLVAGTAAERLSVVAELSAAMWARTRKPLPAYARATMPIKIKVRPAPLRRV